MSNREPDTKAQAGPTDWRAALALAWTIIFGLLYARMVIVERVPQLAAWFR